MFRDGEGASVVSVVSLLKSTAAARPPPPRFAANPAVDSLMGYFGVTKLVVVVVVVGG